MMLTDLPSSSTSSLSDTNLPSSSSSSCTTHTGILRLRPSTSSLSIKFAPLPEVPQRKRRSNAPLGVANRANLMRRQQLRRDGGLWEDQQQQHHHSRVHVHGDGSSVTVEYESGNKSPETEEEDPFVIFGRMVKGATKHLWKKVLPSAAGQPGVALAGAEEENKNLSSAASSQQQGSGPETTVTPDANDMTRQDMQAFDGVPSPTSDPQSIALVAGESTQSTGDADTSSYPSKHSAQVADESRILEPTSNSSETSSQTSRAESVARPPRSDSQGASSQHSPHLRSQMILDNTSPPPLPTT